MCNVGILERSLQAQWRDALEKEIGERENLT